MITGRVGHDVTLHHIHGREVTARFGLSGVARKSSDWLVIPLIAELHVGNEGIDVIGVGTWEKKYGSQLQHFRDMICDYTGRHPHRNDHG